MASKIINFTAGITAAAIGMASKVRVRNVDGNVEVRFTDRTSLVNMPKTELVKDLGVKGNGRRVGLPASLTEGLEAGAKFTLSRGKYNWYRLTPVADGATADVSVSA